MNSLRGIVSFVRTVSAGSFSAAARELGITTVSVSRNVARLERELGVRLLHRTTRALSVTEEGRVLFESSRNVLADLDAAQAQIADRRGEPSGLLHVSSVRVLGRLFVVPLLKEFHLLYPRIQIELLAADRVVDMTDEGFDVGIRTGSEPDTNSVVRKIADLPRLVCASPDYIAAYGTPSSPGELLAHDCICFRSPSTGRLAPWEFTGNDDAMAIAVKGTLLLNDLLAVRDAAIAGLGLAQLPACLTMPHVHAGRLVPVLLDYVPPPTPLFIQYAARKLQPARVRVFVEFMLERLRRNPDLTFDPRRKPAKKNAAATRLRPSDLGRASA